MTKTILTRLLTLLLSTISISAYTQVQAQTPQNEDQKRFWTAQYCDIEYSGKPQNNATVAELCDTAMQYYAVDTSTVQSSTLLFLQQITWIN